MLGQRHRRWPSIDPALDQCLLGYDVLCGLLVLKMNLSTYRPLGYERVYLPLHKVADAPFHIQDDVI